MSFRRTVVVGAALLFVLVSLSQSQSEIKKIPMKSTPASSGQAMYATYCAVCHGLSGKGNGPAARALTAVPTDLTRLATSHAGKFPQEHIYTAIRGDGNMPTAHGEMEMPVWAALFRESCGGVPSETEVHQRISNLTHYVESLQEK